MFAPKARFLKENTSTVKVHADMVDQVVFQEGAEVALLQMVAELPDTTEPTVAMAAYHRIMGARQYYSHLCNVSRPTLPPAEKPVVGTLNHKV